MRADRLLTMVLLLQARGRMTAQALARQLEVSERTIYRDVLALGYAGIPIVAESGTGGGYALVDHYQTRLTGLTASEVQALAALHSLRLLHDLGLGAAVEAAFLKLEAALSPQWQEQLDVMKHSVYLDTTGWIWNVEVVPFLPLLHEAMRLGQQVSIEYCRPDGQTRQRVVAPYGLVAKSTVWYLIGATDEQIRTYRVSRIRKAQLLEAHYQRPSDFDVRTYWESGNAAFEASYTTYVVRLWSTPEGKRRLFEIGSETVRASVVEATTPDSQGCQLLSVAFSSLQHALTMVVGIGTGVKVIEPAELREAIQVHVQQLLSCYT